MSSTLSRAPSPGPSAPGDAPSSRALSLALAVIVTCQLMVVLDASIVNIALPDIQSSLGFSATDLSWVLNAYALAFGGLLLLGGRMGDLVGRRRTFMVGLTVFTVASFVGGLATEGWWLLAARALQGMGAALAAPSALALITTTFPAGPERNRALGVFAGVSAIGASLGLLLGGVLTDVASWRWVMFVNVPFGIVLVAIAPRFITESETRPGRFDLGGAITGTAGMVALVFGFIRISESSWGDALGLGSFALAAALLATFVWLESRAAQPILPLGLLADGPRAAGFVTMLLVAASMFSMFFFLTQFLQDVLGMSPITAGVAFLPLTAGIFTMSRVVPRLLPRIGPTRPLLLGIALIFVSLVWLTQLSPSTTYVGGLLGPTICFGLGGGLCFMPLTTTILATVRSDQAGAASGVLQTMQQAGGALGVAILVTAYASARRDDAAHPVGATPDERHLHALTAGMTSAFTVAAVFAAVALALNVFRAVRGRRVGARAGDGVATAA